MKYKPGDTVVIYDYYELINKYKRLYTDNSIGNGVSRDGLYVNEGGVLLDSMLGRTYIIDSIINEGVYSYIVKDSLVRLSDWMIKDSKRKQLEFNF